MSDRQDEKIEKPAFINANRRGFLQGAAVAGGVAATGIASAAEPLDGTIEVAAETASGKGYELTEHVKKYYKQARF